MSQPLRVAGFELIISGRFWVIAKGKQDPCQLGRSLALLARKFGPKRGMTMRYMKPQVLTTLSATTSIQQVDNFGAKPIGLSRDQSHNLCTPSAYDADE